MATDTDYVVLYYILLYCIVLYCIVEDDGDCDADGDALFFLVRSDGSRCPVFSVGQVALDALFVFCSVRWLHVKWCRDEPALAPYGW